MVSFVGECLIKLEESNAHCGGFIYKIYYSEARIINIRFPAVALIFATTTCTRP